MHRGQEPEQPQPYRDVGGRRGRRGLRPRSLRRDASGRQPGPSPYVGPASDGDRLERPPACRTGRGFVVRPARRDVREVRGPLPWPVMGLHRAAVREARLQPEGALHPLRERRRALHAVRVAREGGARGRKQLRGPASCRHQALLQGASHQRPRRGDSLLLRLPQGQREPGARRRDPPDRGAADAAAVLRVQGLRLACCAIAVRRLLPE